jgi:ribosomal subunit interface protein
MDVLVTGRHCQIPDDYRARVEEKLTSIEKLKDRVIRIDVQVTANSYKRQPDQSTKVEITLRSKGPVVRAEATAEDKLVAFDRALDRLKAQLRRASDRRKAHRALKTEPALSEAGVVSIGPLQTEELDTQTLPGGLEVQGDGPLVVREKFFEATPLTLAQALDQMELVGHDFFLYVDAESGAPSVAYRRKAYDYGVIHLSISKHAAD